MRHLVWLVTVVAASAASPELVLQTGHTGGMLHLAWSPDGRTLASKGADETLRLWDLSSADPDGRAVAGSVCPEGSIAFSPDGRLVAASDRDNAVRLWDVRTRQPAGPPLGPHSDAVTSVAFSPDGRLLASAGRDRTVRLWDVARRQLVAVPLNGVSPVPLCLAFSANGATLAIGGDDRHIRLWDVVARRPIRRLLEGHTDPVVGLAYSPDGRCLASVSREGMARLWNAQSGRAEWESSRDSSATGRAVAVSPDGRWLAVAGLRSVRVWALSASDPTAAEVLRDDYSVQDIAFSPDGRQLAVAGLDGGIRLWDVAAARPPRPPLGAHSDPVWCVAATPARDLVAAGSSDGTVRLWDVRTGLPRRMVVGGQHRFVMALALTPDGATLATRGEEVRLWDAAQGTPVGLPWPGLGLALSADGSLLATREADAVRLWNVATRTPRGQPWPLEPGDEEHADPLALSPEGRTLALADGSALRLWDTATARPRAAAWAGHDRPVDLLAFDPTGTLLLSTARDQTLRCWDAATGAASGPPLSLETAATAVAFSPDGRSLAVGDRTGQLRLLDVAARTWRGPAWRGHSAFVSGLAYCSAGRLLASASEDGTVRLWDGDTGRERATLVSLDAGARHVVIVPGGYYDGSPGADALVAWRLGDQGYPLEQFEAVCHRPDLVRRALAGEDVAAALPLDGTLLPPEVSFVWPEYGAALPGSTVDVAVQAAGTSPIQRLDLTLNGRPLPPALAVNLTLADPTETRHVFQVTLPLPVGEPRVRLRAVASDTHGLRSRVAELRFNVPAAQPRPGGLHVLAVGLGHYSRLPAADSLPSAAADATAVAELFADQGGGRPYAAVTSRLLTDHQATRQALMVALGALQTTVGEGDTVLVYLNGHAVALPDGGFCLPTYDLDLADVANTGLRWQDFAAALAATRAQRVLVLTDLCHRSGLPPALAVSSDWLAARLHHDGHLGVFTAASRDEISLSHDASGQGAFAQALVQGLGALGDADKNGVVTLAEWRNAVTQRVALRTAGQQHPQLPYLACDEPDAVVARVVVRR